MKDYFKSKKRKSTDSEENKKTIASESREQIVKEQLSDKERTEKLFAVIEENNFEELRNLGEISDIVNEKNEYNNASLHYAVLKGNIRIIRLLLEKGVDPNIQGRSEIIPLYYATLKSFQEVISLLLEKGADPSIKDDFGNNPLHVAAERNDLKSLKLLSANNM